MNVHATAARLAPLPVDARGRRGAPADRDRPDHRRARPRGRAARRAGAAAHGALPARQGEGGVVAMRVCIVGCGAVGSLFAANLGDARRRRGVGLRPGARPRRRDQPRRPAADRRRRRRRHGRARRPTRPSCRRATSGSSRRRRCTPTARSPRPRTRSRTAASPRCRTGSATRRCSPRTVERVIRGTTFPAGKLVEPGVVQWDVKGDTTFGPFEAQPGAARPRSSGSPRPARAPACRRTRSPTRAARSGAR